MESLFYRFHHTQATNYNHSTEVSWGIEQGICPLNEHIFTDINYLPSQITDRPDNNTPLRTETPETEEENIETERSTDFILENMQPLLKALLRKPTNRGRKPRKSAALMDNVEMKALRVEQEATVRKKINQ